MFRHPRQKTNNLLWISLQRRSSFFANLPSNMWNNLVFVQLQASAASMLRSSFSFNNVVAKYLYTFTQGNHNTRNLKQIQCAITHVHTMDSYKDLGIFDPKECPQRSESLFLISLPQEFGIHMINTRTLRLFHSDWITFSLNI